MVSVVLFVLKIKKCQLQQINKWIRIEAESITDRDQIKKLQNSSESV